MDSAGDDDSRVRGKRPDFIHSILSTQSSQVAESKGRRQHHDVRTPTQSRTSRESNLRSRGWDLRESSYLGTTFSPPLLISAPLRCSTHACVLSDRPLKYLACDPSHASVGCRSRRNDSEPSLCVLALPSHMSVEVEQARGCPLSRRLTGRRYVRLGILYVALSRADEGTLQRNRLVHTVTKKALQQRRKTGDGRALAGEMLRFLHGKRNDMPTGSD